MSSQKKEEKYDKLPALPKIEEVSKEEIKKEEIDYEKLSIQPIEEYMEDLGYGKDSVIPRNQKAFPDLYSSELDDKDDILSITPGIETTNAIGLYASLLAINIINNKKKKKRNEKSS